MTYEKFVENSVAHIAQTAAAAIQAVTDEVTQLTKTNNSTTTLNLVRINNVAKKAVEDIRAAFESGNNNVAGIIESEITKAELMKENAELQLNTKIESALEEINGILNSGRAVFQQDIDSFISENGGIIVTKGNEQAVRIRLAGDELEQKLRELISLSASGGKAVSVGNLTESDIARVKDYSVNVPDKPVLSLKYPCIIDTVSGLLPTQLTANTIFTDNKYKSGDTIIATITDTGMDISTLTYTTTHNAVYLETATDKYVSIGDKVFRNGALLLDVVLPLTAVVRYERYNAVTWDDTLCKSISEYGLSDKYIGVSNILSPNTIVKTNQFGKISNVLTINYPHGGKLSGVANIVKGTVYEANDGISYIATSSVAWNGDGLPTVESFKPLTAKTLFDPIISPAS